MKLTFKFHKVAHGQILGEVVGCIAFCCAVYLLCSSKNNKIG